MKKVLILANLDIGLYKFRKDLITALVEQGNEVTAALPSGEMDDQIRALGCKLIHVDVDRRGLNPKTDLKLLKRYEKLLKEIHPDMVITYTIKPNIYGGIACSKAKIPYCINITGLGTAFQKGGVLKQMVIAMYKKACKKAHTVFFENEDNRNTFFEHQIIKKEQAQLLHGAGVNLEEYVFTPYPSEEEGIHFLFIGRVMKEKGVDELFAAARNLKSKYENLSFDIVGPFEEDYKETIETLEKEGIIHFYGYQEDVTPFIRQAHCFVLPSYHEGMANTLLENAAMGRPLITSRIHGCMEAVTDGENGLLCEVEDKESLQQKIEQFLALDEAAHQQMGRKSRELMEEKFDKKKVVAETMQGLDL